MRSSCWSQSARLLDSWMPARQEAVNALAQTLQQYPSATATHIPQGVDRHNEIAHPVINCLSRGSLHQPTYPDYSRFSS